MNRNIRFISCLFMLLFISLTNYATVVTYTGNPTPKDTSAKAIKKLANKEAHKAAIMSTIIPGLGQIYNKKYWKTPIIYAALAGMTYLMVRQWDSANVYHNELLFRFQHKDTVTSANYSAFKNAPKSHPWLGVYTSTELNTKKLLYQKRFDEAIIGIGLVYILNIIDASIDGHMKTFDVSDKLSLSVKPKAMYCAQSPIGIGAGISFALTFK